MSNSAQYHTLSMVRLALTSETTSSQNTLATAAISKEPGGAQQSHGIGLVSFLTAIGSGSTLFLAQLCLFLLLRNRLPRIYQPKTYLVPQSQRICPPPRSFLMLLQTLWKFSDKEIIQKCGLDAYFFLRYLKTLLLIFLPVCGTAVPILSALNFVGGRSGQLESTALAQSSVQVSGLDTLSWGNVSSSHTQRYVFHFLISVLVVIWTCAVFYLELRVYVKIRQDYLTSAPHRLRASATTVLIGSIPLPWLTESALRGLFDVFPGGVKNVWLNRDLTQLLDKISYRDRIHSKLESAETSLIQAAKKAQIKKERLRGDEINPHNHNELPVWRSRSYSTAESRASDIDQKQGKLQFVRSFTEASQGITKVIGKAGTRVHDVMETSNGFVRLDETAHTSRDLFDNNSEKVNALPNINSEPWGGNTVGRLNIDNLEEEKTATWWQFWRPPPGSYRSPVPQGYEPTEKLNRRLWRRLWSRIRSHPESPGPPYPKAANADFDTDGEDAVWRKYLEVKDRKTHRLSPFGIPWLPGFPLFNRKVDTIWWCRKELARLNMEIEIDQKHAERYPLLNSAFVQFHSQMAAHMASQTEAHHIPMLMAPRMIEISPQDVIWSNIGLSWWGEWIKTSIVFGVMCLMIVLWAIPMAWTAVLGQISPLIESNKFFQSIKQNETVGNVLGAVSGIMPTLILAFLLVLVPLVLETLADFKGVKTGAQKSEFVQIFYFIFLFIQLFLVVSITSFLTNSLDQLLINLRNFKGKQILDILAINIPKASNYFFSYMILQGLSVSSGILFQAKALVMWYVVSPIFDVSARHKWLRNTKLNEVNWGSLYPVYTNLACIGFIYCIIAPLISAFVVITFSLFWIAQRYTMIYVTQFNHDTGGILYPRAINQTFTGLYLMELCLSGLFFIVEDERGARTCVGYGILMMLILALTILYQLLLNISFGPLLRYLPITVEDEAILREEAFERARKSRPSSTNHRAYQRGSQDTETALDRESQPDPDIKLTMTNALYKGVKTQIEHLTPHERSILINEAFNHEALRSRRPSVWIPKDDLGVSDDEVYRTRAFSTYISISNTGAALDKHGQVIYGKSPPDSTLVDTIKL